jgi:hypothetical protein
MVQYGFRSESLFAQHVVNVYLMCCMSQKLHHETVPRKSSASGFTVELPASVRWTSVVFVRQLLISILYQPLNGRRVWSSRWNENWQGEPKFSEKTCPNASLCTTNHMWSNLTRARTQAAAVLSLRYTAWALTLPTDVITTKHNPDHIGRVMA